MEFVLRQGYVRLGILRVIDVDQPWLKCTFEETPTQQNTLPLFEFEPPPDYEAIRPLFETAYHLWEHDTDYEAWEEAYSRIDKLGLSLATLDGAGDIHDF